VSLKINRIIHDVEEWVLSYMLGIVRIIHCCTNNWSRVVYSVCQLDCELYIREIAVRFPEQARDC